MCQMPSLLRERGIPLTSDSSVGAMTQVGRLQDHLQGASAKLGVLEAWWAETATSLLVYKQRVG